MRVPKSPLAISTIDGDAHRPHIVVYLKVNRSSGITFEIAQSLSERVDGMSNQYYGAHSAKAFDCGIEKHGLSSTYSQRRCPSMAPSSGAELGVTLRKGQAVVRRSSTNWPTSILRVVGDLWQAMPLAERTAPY